MEKEEISKSSDNVFIRVSLLKYIIVIFNVHINGRILTEYSGLLSLAFIIANWLHNILNLGLARISLPIRDW